MSRAGMFTIAPQEREVSVPVSSRSAFPRSCTKFEFPRARVPKMPGTRERKSRNARPPLVLISQRNLNKKRKYLNY